MELAKLTFWIQYIIFQILKSYFNPVASQNIKHGESFFFISGKFEINEKEENILVSLKKVKKKYKEK